MDKGWLVLDVSYYEYWIDGDIEDYLRYKKLTPKLKLAHQTGFPHWRYLMKNSDRIQP